MKKTGRRPVQGQENRESFMEGTAFYLMGNGCKVMREKGWRQREQDE